MYKTIWCADSALFDQLLNDAEKDGFAVVSFAPHWISNEKVYRIEAIFTALMHKPDTAPTQRVTTEQYLAMRTPMERIADTADNVLREEARQYSVGR